MYKSSIKTLKKRPTAHSYTSFTLPSNNPSSGLSTLGSKRVETLILSDKAGDIIALNVPLLTNQV